MSDESEKKNTMPRRRIRRDVVFVLVGVVLVGAALFFYRCWLVLPVGSGPAGPAVPAEPFRTPWTDREVVVLGIGDSVTAGFGASQGKSYVDRLVVNPPDEFPDMQGICLKAVLPRLRVENVAVSGSNSFSHAEDQIVALRPFPKEVYGVVVMTSGGNDLIHWYGRRAPEDGAMYGATLAQAGPWIAGFERRLNGMLEDISARFPGGCTIFLANIYDPSDGGASPVLLGMPRWKDSVEILRAYNDVIARCAASHGNVALVDMHGAFMGHGVRCAQFWRSHYDANDPHYWYFQNIEDPNERGYDAIRRLFLLKIVERLGTPSSPLRVSPAK